MPVVAGDAAAGVEVVEEDVRWRFLEEEEDRAAAEPVAVAGAGDAGPSVFSLALVLFFVFCFLSFFCVSFFFFFSDLPVSGAEAGSSKRLDMGARA